MTTPTTESRRSVHIQKINSICKSKNAPISMLLKRNRLLPPPVSCISMLLERLGKNKNVKNKKENKNKDNAEDELLPPECINHVRSKVLETLRKLKIRFPHPGSVAGRFDTEESRTVSILERVLRNGEGSGGVGRRRDDHSECKIPCIRLDLSLLGQWIGMRKANISMVASSVGRALDQIELETTAVATGRRNKGNDNRDNKITETPKTKYQYKPEHLQDLAIHLSTSSRLIDPEGTVRRASILLAGFVAFYTGSSGTRRKMKTSSAAVIADLERNASSYEGGCLYVAAFESDVGGWKRGGNDGDGGFALTIPRLLADIRREDDNYDDGWADDDNDGGFGGGSRPTVRDIAELLKLRFEDFLAVLKTLVEILPMIRQVVKKMKADIIYQDKIPLIGGGGIDGRDGIDHDDDINNCQRKREREDRCSAIAKSLDTDHDEERSKKLSRVGVSFENGTHIEKKKITFPIDRGHGTTKEEFISSDDFYKWSTKTLLEATTVARKVAIEEYKENSIKREVGAYKDASEISDPVITQDEAMKRAANDVLRHYNLI